MEHSISERAYLAGLMDGEGSIGINNFGGKRVPAIRVTITNTNLAVLNELQEIWGGAVTTRRIRVPGWKASSDLLFAAKTAASILREIQPYLRIKKEQCRLALRFAETVNNRQTRGVPIDIQEYRQKIRSDIKLLNTRGVPTS